MISYSLIDDLRSGTLTLSEFIVQVETRFAGRESSIQAFIPQANRFPRLHEEADALLLSHTDLITRPPLFGALAGIKDIFHVDGFPTQAGSRLPADVLQGTQAESVTRLKDAGALIMGKTATTEFAYFTPGPTRNPHNPEHTPGGSSSGSAAAVAAGFCSIALGTQTIGSIIRPASFCGVVGLKPTYDRISRAGVIPLSPSLDHVGFFTADVETAIHAARAMYMDWDEPLAQDAKPILGIPNGPYLASASDFTLGWFDRTCRVLSDAGYELRQIEILDDYADIRARNDVIMSAEAAQVHKGWFEEYETLYSAKFADLIRRGQSISNDQYQAALSACDDFRADIRRSFTDHNIDLWICPSAVDAAPKGLESTGDPVMNLPWTQAGLPALNLPAGKNADGLPMGLQLIANWYKDESLLFWAKELQRTLAGGKKVIGK